jgi:putative DNA primase/helicase
LDDLVGDQWRADEGTERCTASEGASHDPRADEAEIARLASLSPLAYDREREKAAKSLGVRITTLDEQVKARRERSKATEALNLCTDIEPWSEPIIVAELLDEVRSTIRRFIVCDPSTVTATALWIAFTWIIDHAQVAPMAIITAPEKRCGKTQLLDVMGRLSMRGLFASSISPAATFRVIEAKSPTLLIDEADAFFRENEELRGIVNSGHTRSSAFVIRCVGESFEPKRFSTWCAKAIAGIGKLADTVMDRAIMLSLRRKLPHEKAERLRHAEPGLFKTLASKLARFGEDHGAAIGRMRPLLPEALNDRAQDNWEPLLAIADLAGGNWPKDARRAALVISGDANDGRSTGEDLLSDIRDIFDADGADRFSMAELIKRLCEDDMAPWATCNRGKPMTPRQLGKKLGEFGVVAKAIHVSQYEKPKGFLRSQFADAWSRYLDGRSENGQAADDTLSPDAPLGPVTRSPFNKSGDFPVTEAVTEKAESGHWRGQSPAQAEVTDAEGDQTAEIRSPEKSPEKPLYSRQGDRVTDENPLPAREASDGWREVTL